MTQVELPPSAPSTAPEAPSAGPEPTWPFPPRYWWLKRLTLWSALLGLLLGAVYAAWAREAQRRLGPELARVVAAGEPIDAAGMNAPPTPDAQNGAALYRQASKALNRTVESPANSNIDYTGYPPFPPRWHRLADRAIPANTAALALMREARGYSRFDWGVRVTRPAYATLLPHLNEARELANVAGDAALYHHLHGDDAEAIELIRDIRREAAGLTDSPTFAITHLVAEGCESLALTRLEVIAPGLTIEPDGSRDAGIDAATAPRPLPAPATQPARRPATRAQVRALIAELLDDRAMTSGLRGVYVNERAAQLDMVDWFGQTVPTLRPMFELDAVNVVRLNDSLASAATQPTLPAARVALRSDPILQQIGQPQTGLLGVLNGRGPGRLAAKRQPIDYTRFFTTDVCAVTGTGSSRVVETSIRVRTDAHLAAASLAVQLYRADHGGAFPASLDALVPRYLPAVPVDPMSGAGKPIGYYIARGALPDGGDRPLVYSVGLDGADDTAAGGSQLLPNRPCFGSQKLRDEWRDVSRWVPQPTPRELLAEEESEKEAAAAPKRPVK